MANCPVSLLFSGKTFRAVNDSLAGQSERADPIATGMTVAHQVDESRYHELVS